VQPLPTPAAVRAALPEDAVLVDYLVAPERLRACIWTRAATHWLDLGPFQPVSEALGRVGLLLAGLSRLPTPEQRRQAAAAQASLLTPLLARLYDLLLAPLAAHLSGAERLWLAPDGPLYELPWAALPVAGQSLSERYEVRVLPSAAVLALPETTAPPAGPPLALGYAGEPPLLEMEAELARIRATVPEMRVSCPAGRSDLVWDTAPRWLHIAAHGRLNRRAPLLSRLALADGDFLWAEALHLPLWGTDLVTLSACETGVLPERGGVALALAGAFLCAGARATLASLWAVDDAAAQQLMATFYGALQAGQDIASALRHAQQALRQAGYVHPYYWAAFQLLARCVMREA